MALMQSLNVGLSFLLEVGMLGAFAYWGFHAAANPWLRWVLAVAAPLAAIVAWGLFLAPKAARRVGSTAGIAASLGMFCLAALALFSVGQPAWGAVMLIAAVLNRGLVVAWRQW
jgi:hypothetical protein